jgi:putative acetyltransferase
MAYMDGRAAGCGAVVAYSGYAEVKRIYVDPQYRGAGVAKRLLDTLEKRTLELGYSMLRLETGIYQPDAVALYERCGFRRCAQFGDYPDIALSVFMEKSLA